MYNPYYLAQRLGQRLFIFFHYPEMKSKYPRLPSYLMDSTKSAHWDIHSIAALKGPYNANSTFIVLLYVHMRSWHVSQPTNA